MTERRAEDKMTRCGFADKMSGHVTRLTLYPLTCHPCQYSHEVILLITDLPPSHTCTLLPLCYSLLMSLAWLHTQSLSVPLSHLHRFPPCLDVLLRVRHNVVSHIHPCMCAYN